MQKVTGIIIVIYVLTACSSARKAAPRDTEITRETITLAQIANNNLLDVNFDITRAEISYTDNENNEELIAQISFRKESQYLISLRTKAGFELGRIFITKDTILGNDRLNRKLFYGSTSQFAGKYGIELQWLPVLFGDISVSDRDSSIAMVCKGNETRLEKGINSGSLVYYIDCRKEKVRMVEIARSYGKGIAIVFGNFVENGGKKYPTEIEITDNENHSKIKIKIGKTEIDTERRIRFIPGDGYEKIMIR